MSVIPANDTVKRNPWTVPITRQDEDGNPIRRRKVKAMTDNQPERTIDEPQATALEMAKWVHDRARAVRTYLFGSRARGDHHLDSDIDILIITDKLPEEKALDIIREEARKAQKKTMPEVSGVDVVAMTLQDFQKRRRLINNLAWTIDKEGIMAVGEETLDYGRYHEGDEDEDYNNSEPDHPQQDRPDNYLDESETDRIDWEDVDLRRKDSTGCASDIELWREANILEGLSDKSFGHTAQQALENAYQVLLGANGHSYPTGGNDGHNLRILLEKIRKHSTWPPEQEVPGESYQYLTEFADRKIHTHEHLPLGKHAIARDIPDAVESLITAVEETERQNRPAEQ